MARDLGSALSPTAVGGTGETPAPPPVRFLGPGLLERTPDGRARCTVASAFPRWNTVVTSGSLHAVQAVLMADWLRQQAEAAGQPVPDDEDVYADAVPLLVRDGRVVIRSDPEDMGRILGADEMLQRLLPRDIIQFTGVHLPGVRQRLRWRGERWRVSPPPRSVPEVARFIEGCRTRVGTGATYYQDAHSGARFLTYQELMAIRPLLRSNRSEACRRLMEILELTGLVNRQGARELAFFLPAGRHLPREGLMDLLELITDGAEGPPDQVAIERAFDALAHAFAEAAGPELLVDGGDYVGWRTTMFCRLYGVCEDHLEESALGLSREFHMNVRWLPGAALYDGKPQMDPRAEPRVRGLIEDYCARTRSLRSINVGRVEAAQTGRDLSGQEREVLVVVLGREDGTEDIRVVRMLKWDVFHRLKRGVPHRQAVSETVQYRDWILDRIRGAQALRLPIPTYREIRIEERVEGLPPVPVFFIDRPYVAGVATDKLAPALYARPGFAVRLMRVLGVAAAASLVLGRGDLRSGRFFFDDGDEVIQLGADGLPERLVLADTTGSFTDWSSPIERLLPVCLHRVAVHLERARTAGIPAAELAEAVEGFVVCAWAEVVRMQALVADETLGLRRLYGDRTTESGGIRQRWDHILDRLVGTREAVLRAGVAACAELRPWVRA
ncbi:MAG: hypothetical protein HY904_22830 [Deltaproteobacteria bacterium]|nr:hypothetical protein [Deltaproteobacteria bacterium]